MFGTQGPSFPEDALVDEVRRGSRATDDASDVGCHAAASWRESQATGKTCQVHNVSLIIRMLIKIIISSNEPAHFQELFSFDSYPEIDQIFDIYNKLMFHMSVGRNINQLPTQTHRYNCLHISVMQCWSCNVYDVQVNEGLVYNILFFTCEKNPCFIYLTITSKKYQSKANELAYKTGVSNEFCKSAMPSYVREYATL